MPPEVRENKEFSRWLEQWMAKIQQGTFHEHEAKGSGEQEEQPPTPTAADHGRRAA